MTEGAYLMDRIRHKCLEDGDCLIWQGDKSVDGVPRYYIDRKRKNLRHLLWVEKNGREPDAGKRVGVRCKRAGCVAEDHLVARSRQQELKGVKRTPDTKIRIALAKRKSSKYSDEFVQMVREMAGNHLEIAKQLGMHYQTVQRIRKHEIRREYVNPFAGLGAR